MEGPEVLEGTVQLPNVPEGGLGEGSASPTTVEPRLVNLHEAFRLGKGKGLEQHAVQDAEHRAVGPNAEGKGSQAVAKLLEQGAHMPQRPSKRRLHTLDADEAPGVRDRGP
jgi:hypothetical protein